MKDITIGEDGDYFEGEMIRLWVEKFEVSSKNDTKNFVVREQLSRQHDTNRD